MTEWESGVCVCLRVCLCVCVFSLMDSFLPRSSRRPSPLLLQDAHSSSVYRSLHLQTAASASLAGGPGVAPPRPAPDPCSAQPKKKENTHTHTTEVRRVFTPSCNPRITNLLYKYTTDFSTWVKTLRRFWQWPPPKPPEPARPQITELLSKRDLTHEVPWLFIWSCNAETTECLRIKAGCS